MNYLVMKYCEKFVQKYIEQLVLIDNFTLLLIFVLF